MLTRCTQ